jgi:D-alanine-D-alanine ligase
MDTRVRNMNAADKPALMSILYDTPEFKPFEVTVAEEVIDSYLKNPAGSGYNILVAENDTGVTGYICYGPTPCTMNTWDIYWQAVARQKRGYGIGSALTRIAEANIEQTGGRLIMIETSSALLYKNTRRFHINRGYEIIARIPDFYAPGDDKIILQKRIEH